MGPTKEKPTGKRKSISLQTKQDIIRMKDKGHSSAEIMKKYELSSSTVATIYSAQGRSVVKKALAEQISMQATKVNDTLKTPVFHDMEEILYQYIQFNIERKIYLKENVICEKAREIFKFLMDEERGLYTPDGYRIKKGAPTPIIQQREAMGTAYQLPEDHFLRTEADFEGFDDVNITNTDQGVAVTKNVSEPVDSLENITADPSNSSSMDFENNSKPVRKTFCASQGWYHRCVRNRWGYRYVKKHGEADSSDKAAAQKFGPQITQFILDHFDGPEFIYNVDELGLYYKKLLNCCIDTSEKRKQMKGFKQNTTRVTLLVGGNAAGEKLKPFMIGSSQMPHSLRGINRDNLNCYYHASKKSWMNSNLFWKWFMDCFIHEMEERHGDDFLVLLTLDNCTAHPPEITDHDPRVIVCFLPKNTTALIQPMDQGIIRNFKLRFHDKIYLDLIRHIDTVPITEEGVNPMVQFYKDLTIYDTIKYTCDAWFDGVKKSTMINCWHNFFDQNKIKGFPQYASLVRKEKNRKEVTDSLENIDEELSEQNVDDINDTPEQIEENEESVEESNIINGLVNRFSNSNIGITSAKEIEDLLIFEEAEMTVLDVAQEFIINRENSVSTNLSKEQLTEKVKTKDLQELLCSFNNLQIQMNEVLESNDKILTESLENLNLAIKPVRNLLNEKYEQFSQTEITKFYPKQKNARAEAKRLSSHFMN